MAIPSDLPNSRCGNQLLMVLAVTTACGPSPNPNRKRMIQKLKKLKPAAVSAVKADHQATAMAITLRGPNISEV